MKKQLKLVICLLLCFGILLSTCLIEHNAEHNCIGEDCQICRDIAAQRQILKSILLCLLSGGAVVFISQLTLLISSFVNEEKRRLNLVANKVKLTA